jgi:hypothetical protein
MTSSWQGVEEEMGQVPGEIVSFLKRERNSNISKTEMQLNCNYYIWMN